jgi:hypothetical protein
VHHPLRVRRRQPAGRLRADAQHLRQRQRAGAQPLQQRQAADVLHHQVGLPVCLLDDVDGDDVVVADGGRGPGLAGEAVPGRGAAGQGRGEHLDGHHPVEGGVESLVDDAQGAPAQLGLHLVMPELANLAGPHGGSQEGAGGFSAGRLDERLVPHRPVPLFLRPAQGCHGLPAAVTGSEVSAEGRLLVERQGPRQELLPALAVGAGG